MYYAPSDWKAYWPEASTAGAAPSASSSSSSGKNSEVSQVHYGPVQLTVHDVETLLVDLQVLVVLQVVDVDHSAGLLDELSVLVGSTRSGSLLVDISDLQDVLQTVKGDLNYLVVHGVEQVAHWLDAALGNEVSDLVGLLKSARSGVRNGPTGLLLGLKIGVLQNVDQRRNDVAVCQRGPGYYEYSRVNDRLNLQWRPGGDVGNGPAGLLSDTVLGRGEQAKQSWQGAGRNDDLSLQIVTSDDVTD